MLVISRKDGEYVEIGGIRVYLVSSKMGRARIGIDAPREIPVTRGPANNKKLHPEKTS